ncbi:MAG: Yip1 family protein [Rhodocyclaceae bacterium]|nr:Yip1 family protein [Rhodocyclaceae bacterium]
MTLANLPKMVLSEADGWPDVLRIHPTVAQLFAFLVAPMSLIPPLMYAYAQLVHPGVVFALVEPPLRWQELTVVGITFFAIEVANVALMASYIQQLGGIADVHPDYPAAYTLAAIAPTPLWLSALCLFVPIVWFDALVVIAAWSCSVALIRNGVRPLFKVADAHKALQLANAITAAGVAVWIGMLLLFMMMLGILFGWR